MECAGTGLKRGPCEHRHRLAGTWPRRGRLGALPARRRYRRACLGGAERAFEEAGLALTRAVTAAEIKLQHHDVEVVCEAPDLELLLVEWLNAIVYEMAVRRMVFGRFAVTIEAKRRLRSTLRGNLWMSRDMAPAVEPKGATCTALRVGREPDGRWAAACVVDV